MPQSRCLYCDATTFDSGVILRDNTFYWEGGSVRLTKMEARIVEAIYSAKGRTVSRGHVFDELYSDMGYSETDERIVHVALCRIRKKLKAAGAPFIIKTVWGCGYKTEKADGVVEHQVLEAAAADAPREPSLGV